MHLMFVSYKCNYFDTNSSILHQNVKHLFNHYQRENSYRNAFVQHPQSWIMYISLFSVCLHDCFVYNKSQIGCGYSA